jgi:hypothetical protein
MMRVLVPARLRTAVRTWFDSRYISIADHRQDIRDALWEVQTLRREVATLHGEVERLRSTPAPPAAGKAPASKASAAPVAPVIDRTQFNDTRRLAQETAKALDRVLQNEVLVWQAIDDLRSRTQAAGNTDSTEGGSRELRSEEQPCA